MLFGWFRCSGAFKKIKRIKKIKKNDPLLQTGSEHHRTRTLRTGLKNLKPWQWNQTAWNQNTMKSENLKPEHNNLLLWMNTIRNSLLWIPHNKESSLCNHTIRNPSLRIHNPDTLSPWHPHRTHTTTTKTALLSHPPPCHPVTLTPWHPITLKPAQNQHHNRITLPLPPCHLVILSLCHPVTLTPCHPATLPPWHPVTLTPCHLVTLTHSNPETLTPCYPDTLTPCLSYLSCLSLCVFLLNVYAYQYVYG